MATDVVMPQMGESIAEGTVVRWIKKVGDTVDRDEPLFEISTDKVDAEIPAPSAGVLAEIKVQEGQTVPVQTLVAVIETDKAAVTTASPAVPPVAAAQRAPAAPGGTAVSPPSTSPVLPRPSPSSPVPPKGDGAETAEERLRRKSTPLVRKIAAEHQVDISTIPGSGFAGRGGTGAACPACAARPSWRASVPPRVSRPSCFSCPPWPDARY